MKEVRVVCNCGCEMSASGEPFDRLKDFSMTCPNCKTVTRIANMSQSEMVESLLEEINPKADFAHTCDFGYSHLLRIGDQCIELPSVYNMDDNVIYPQPYKLLNPDDLSIEQRHVLGFITDREAIALKEEAYEEKLTKVSPLKGHPGNSGLTSNEEEPHFETPEEPIRDVDLEVKVISGLMKNNRVSNIAFELLSYSDFSEERRTIFNAMHDIWAEGRNITKRRILKTLEAIEIYIDPSHMDLYTRSAKGLLFSIHKLINLNNEE